MQIIINIDLSSFNTQNVTLMSWMFSDCHSLTSIDLSHLNTQNVTHMSFMFNDCYSLINISKFNIKDNTS